MAGKQNTAETNVLLLIFTNANWANIGDATGLRGSSTAGNLYVGLHTASPAETGTETTSETAFTNYARVAVVRSSSGWTVASGQSQNAAAINFPQCGATGATVTDFHVGSASSGTGEVLYFGSLTASLAVSNGITPSFAINALTITED